jgi:2-polyprenyl-6-methoxyphenol hydroxylase-like FAD-dependent oxidoreductase
MCGVMLKHHGYNVTILEQEVSAFRHRGYDAGIKIGPAVDEFLKKHDRVKREMTVTCPPGFLINIEGKPKMHRGQTVITTSWGLMISVLRANFDDFTSTAVPVAPGPQEGDGEAIFRFAARATSVDVNEVDGKAEVHFLDAKSGMTQVLRASMAIVADGTNSSIRRTLLPDTQRNYLGYMCWRGTAREEDVGEKWNELYAERATFHLMNKSYLLKYVSSAYIDLHYHIEVRAAIRYQQTMGLSRKVSACIIGSGTQTFLQNHLN